LSSKALSKRACIISTATIAHFISFILIVISVKCCPSGTETYVTQHGREKDFCLNCTI